MHHTHHHLTIAERIRDLREKKRLSKTDLAAATGIAVSEVVRLERGACGLGPRRAERIARALGVTTGELLRG